jgi:hypothetical protein
MRRALAPETPYTDFLFGCSLDDELWYMVMRTHRRNRPDYRELTRPMRDMDRPLLHLIGLGVYDNADKPNDGAVRAMRHSSAMMDRMWELFEVERERVLLFSCSTFLTVG